MVDASSEENNAVPNHDDTIEKIGCTEVQITSSPKCIHCHKEIKIEPPYNVNWESVAWINCPNIKCKRPNQFRFLKGSNVSIVNITKFKTATLFSDSIDDSDKELVTLLNEVEDSSIHERYRGAAIVLRVCLEHLVWVKTLGKEAVDVKINPSVLRNLEDHMSAKGFKNKEIDDAKNAFEFLADLGDTAAHYQLRDPSRIKLPTKANVDLGMWKFDQLSNIIYKWRS